MVMVVCNKAKEHGCNYNVCYYSEPHEKYIECNKGCPIFDDDVECEVVVT